jgi:hypothetical protein
LLALYIEIFPAFKKNRKCKKSLKPNQFLFTGHHLNKKANKVVSYSIVSCEIYYRPDAQILVVGELFQIKRLLPPQLEMDSRSNASDLPFQTFANSPIKQLHFPDFPAYSALDSIYE